MANQARAYPGFCGMKRLVVHSFAPTSISFNHRATVSGVLLNLAGVENFVTSASCILAVFMERAVNHGSASASLNGEDGFVIKVTRALGLKLSFVETFRFAFIIRFFITVSLLYEIAELN